MQFNVYSSWNARPPALMQRLDRVTMVWNERWIIWWSMLRHFSNNCLTKLFHIVHFSCWSCGTFQIFCFRYPKGRNHTLWDQESGATRITTFTYHVCSPIHFNMPFLCNFYTSRKRVFTSNPDISIKTGRKSLCYTSNLVNITSSISLQQTSWFRRLIPNQTW